MNAFTNLFRATRTQTLCCTAALFALAAPSLAQRQGQPNVVNMDIRTSIDAVGNGEMKLTLRMNAQEWVNWKRQYGANPSVFKRDLCKKFTQYELTDFDLEQDDMDREAVVTIRGKGLATYAGNGAFEIELGKELAKGELVDGEYRVTYTEPQGPSSLSLIDQRIDMPGGASRAEVTTNAYGEPVLRYSLPVGGGGLPWLWIGVGTALAGIGLVFASTRMPRPQPRPLSEVAPVETLAS